MRSNFARIHWLNQRISRTYEQWMTCQEMHSEKLSKDSGVSASCWEKEVQRLAEEYHLLLGAAKSCHAPNDSQHRCRIDIRKPPYRLPLERAVLTKKPDFNNFRGSYVLRRWFKEYMPE